METVWQVAAAMAAAGTVLSLLAKGIGFAARKWISPGALYGLWVTALLFFLLPAGWALVPRAEMPALGESRPVCVGADAAQKAEPFLSGEEPASDGTRPAGAGSVRWEWVLWGARGVWALGTAAALARCAARRIRGGRLLRRLKTDPPLPTTRQVLRQAASPLRMRRIPVCAVCAGIGSPMLTGLLRPRILLPPELETPTEAGALPAVLTHELLHARRGDLWWKLLAELAVCLYWWDPAAWMMFRELERYGERSCDARAARGCSPEERREYGLAILRAAERTGAACQALPADSCLWGRRFAEWRNWPAARALLRRWFPDMESGSRDKRELKRRLKDMIQSRKMTKRGWAAAVCGLLVLGAAGLLVGCALMPERPAAGVPADGTASLPQEQAAALTQQFARGVSYDPDSGALEFAAPAEPEGMDRYLQVSGRSRMEAGDGTGMSLHLFEEESAADNWEADHTYRAELPAEQLEACSLYLSYTDAESGELLAEVTVDLPVGEAGTEPAASSDEEPAGDAVPGEKTGTAAGLGLPVAGWEEFAVTQPFGKTHTGIDIAARGENASAKGEPVYAAAAGRVRTAGWQDELGWTVQLEHDGGIETWYAHCRSLSVQEGDTVEAGQQIGEIGQSGFATGACLHFAVWADGTAVDPLGYLPTEDGFLQFRF